jgi:hypothetical protein
MPPQAWGQVTATAGQPSANTAPSEVHRVMAEASPTPSRLPPPNDDLANATPIVAFPFSETIDVTAATFDDPGVEVCYSGQNVWYTFILDQPHWLRVNRDGSTYWQTVDVYTGSPGSLTRVFCAGDQLISDFHADAGITYYVMITGGGGWLNLVMEILYPPSNDAIGNALVIDALPFSADVPTAAATWDDPQAQACYTDRNIWYTFTLPESQHIAVIDGALSSWWGADLYSGESGALTWLACSERGMDFQAEAGVTYYLMVTSRGGDVRFSMQVETPPVNDDLGNAIAITTPSFSEQRDTTWASRDNPAAGSCVGGKNVWYALHPDGCRRWRLA